eukprot:TRINITY_DN4131_c0_g1_i4.p1 TRINITY_DN4131_c0_g1~~TRINITY_DN4131_c0_g1_i4.p1  ORF type:complete len:341 (+),score=98.59 TRINITY_DN4131_c0_g1_i4:34-1056(+)
MDVVIPPMMKAVVFDGQKVELKEVPTPKPLNGEVLIKVVAAPINSADVEFIRGHFPAQKPLPAILGFEGSGVVIQNGGGLTGWRLVGKRVAFAAPNNKSPGAWAEYIVVSSTMCFAIDEDMDIYKASCSFINPLTVIMMMDILSKEKHEAVVQSAAASSLGRMLIRSCRDAGIRTINIVRDAAERDSLIKEGAEIVLDSSLPDFEVNLQQLCREHNATCGFDAVGGDLTGKMLRALCHRGVVYLMGCLSGERSRDIDAYELLSQRKRLEGFLLTEWIEEKGTYGRWWMMSELFRGLRDKLQTKIVGKFPHEQLTEALKYYEQHCNEGKVLLVSRELQHIQ